MRLCGSAATTLLFALAAAPAPAAERHAITRLDAASVDRALRSAVDDGRIPGVVAMVATPDAVIYHGTFGKREIGASAPMTEDTIFRIFSMTKPVTSVAAMQLVERGKVSLDDPVSKYLPALAKLNVLDGFENGEPKLHPAATAITVRHLLTHTSGFAYSFLNKDLMDFLTKRGLGPMAHPDDEPISFEPGARWQYGISTDKLGNLIEAVSGQTLAEYFQHEIFAPLGMEDTDFNIAPEKQSRVPAIQQRQGDGTLHETPRQAVPPVTSFSGGGGLYSTGGDYVKFMQMLLRRGSVGKTHILRPETVDLMTRNQIGDLQAGRLTSVMPARSKNVDFHPGVADKFGFGFLINPVAYPEGRSAGSLAWAGLANTYFWIDPERKICAVLLMQVLPFFDDDAVALLRNFEHAVYASQ